MSWIQTYTGRKFCPLEPRAEDVFLEDIAHALSNQCRFSGHCEDFYSVAQHSVLVALCVERRGHGTMATAAALLHDASEAYLVDVPRPIKPHLVGYKAIEDAVMAQVAVRFGIMPEWFTSNVIKGADERLLATEARDLMRPAPEHWGLLRPPLDEKIIPWQPSMAKRMFLDNARRLGLR
jgi:hypothetical protein